jgi:phospholipid/cholesterol/gamma-HCH transport system ATP-binding protein
LGTNADRANVISIRDLHKSFGPQVIFNGLNLDFEATKTTVVMGPSGCGKSVMLKHIVGLLHPDSGSITFEGKRVDQLSETELEPVRLQIGLLFQSGALFDSMTVAENIAFPLIEHTRMTRDERAQAITDALAMVDMSGVEHKLPAQLSGGQRKRVALARAIVLRPRVVLYDEPTTGLDPIRADGINDLIIKLKEKMGVTNIVVTHDLSSAHKVADRVVMLLGGNIAADGRFEDLAKSTDPRVQHFLTGKYDRSDVDGLEEQLTTQVRDTLEEKDIGV